MTKRFSRITQALDADSYQWLADNHPDLSEAIEVEVGHGAAPEAIRRHVVDVTDRVELARRCQQAARHVAAQSPE